MKDGIRILSPHNINEIAIALSKERSVLLNTVEKAVGDTIKFSQSAANAMGDISYDEAVKGIIDFFTQQMRNTL